MKIEISVEQFENMTSSGTFNSSLKEVHDNR